jgi:asparagine synthase (glutamine-hydrolysing)
MCGIAGYFSTHKSFEKNELENITNSMPHRGPDATGLYWNDSQTCGLGHRRLSIIDLSTAANQPMYSHCKRYVMVFNGEVFNYQSIAEELQKAHQQKMGSKIEFTTTSDTEVILEAFCFWGNDFVHHLNGMFAIAIYDTHADELYLFRDRLGVKPIYYYHQNNVLVFGSELKAVLQFSLVKNDLQIDKEALNQYLHIGYITEPLSIYKYIKKFPSGSFAVFNKAELQIKYYWKAEDKIEATTHHNFIDSKLELKTLLLDSVKLRMISDVPFGTFLSGGIDSSLVTAMAQHNSSTPIKTFSIGFKEAKYNESAYAKQVSDYLKTNHHQFIVSEKDAIDLVTKIPDAYDEPYADSSALPTMLVSKLAKQHVTMTLSGDGGDELMMGYGMYNWANRLNNPLVSAARKPASMLMKLMSSKYKRVAELLNYEDEKYLHSHIFSQEQYLFSRNEVKNLVLKNYQSDFDVSYNFNTNRKLSAAEQQALFDIKFYLKDDLLVKVDRASMQYSLETRTPFLDYRVVEYCLNISEKFKMNNGIQKYLLKEILYDFVPKEMFDRPKWGFSIPLVNWLKADLKFLIDEYLSESSITKSGLVDYEIVKDLKSKFFSNKFDYLYNRLWLLVVLHMWHNKK